ncbi:MAG: hypothetical protein NZ927_08760 [Candidatus Calescibacterium sp.]|nr:hypothetical protein [Candidatus Calescibacterium sp.]MCX7734866.1 hypothetical protein [bacterium]MDW8087894.1 hypothetical protein [Candidatus Calescibacterium sp.]
MSNILKNLFLILLAGLLVGCGRFSLDYDEEKRITIYEGDILVASGDSGLYNSFAQDKKGGIHIVYYQIPRATILWSYSSNLRKGFEKTEIITQAGVGDNFGISAKVLIDSSNKPHVIYIRHIEGGTHLFRIFHARREDEGKWIDEPAPTCGFESKAEKLDAIIDPEDIIHVAYIGMDKKLYYISFRTNGELVSCEVIDPAVGEVSRVPAGGGISECVDMTMDSAGTIHVSYYDSENGNTKYAFKKKGEQSWAISIPNWQRVFNEEIRFSQVTPGEYTAELQFPSNEAKLDTYIFAVGPGGRKEVPKDFWRFRGQKNIVLSGNIVGPDKEFNLNMKFYVSYIRTDTSPEDDGVFCSVSFNELLAPIIAFYDSTNMRIKFSQKNGEIWETEEVEPAQIGSPINLVTFKIDDKTTPAIVYSDSLRNSVRVLIRNPSPPTQEERWIKSTIISQVSAGYHLFSSFIPIYGKIGVSYIKIVKGSFELYFSVFDVINEVKEAIKNQKNTTQQ